jgi:hypothetical protein
MAASPRRSVGEVLLDTTHTADVLFRQIRDQLVSEGASPETVDQLQVALERAHRLAKTSHEAGVEERLVRLQEQQGQLLAGGLKWLLGVFGVGGDDRALRAVSFMLRELAAGRVPAGDRAGVAVDLVRVLPGSESFHKPVADRDWDDVKALITVAVEAVGSSWDDPRVQAAVRASLEAGGQS